MIGATLLAVSALPLLTAASPADSLVDFTAAVLAGLQAQGLTQTTAVLQSLGASIQPTLQSVFQSQNSTKWTLYAPTNAAWAALSTPPSDPLSVLSGHIVGPPLSNYVTPNYTVLSSADGSSRLPPNATHPVVVVTGDSPVPIVMCSNYNSTGLTNGGFYGIQVVPVDTVISQPPTLREVLTQDLIPRAADSTVNTNFTMFSAFLDSFGYLDNFSNVTGLTVFAPTDAAMTAAAPALARLSARERAVVAMNHFFQGQVLYSPILSGSSQLSSSSGGRLSWCRNCGNSTNQRGLSMLVVGTNISAEVLRTDVIIDNGALHAISGVLINTVNNTRNANVAPSTSRRASTTAAAPSSTATFGTSGATATSSVVGGLVSLLAAISVTGLALFA